MHSKNRLRIKIMSAVLIVEMLTREFMVLGDKSVTDKFYLSRILIGLSTLAFSYVSFVFDLSNHPIFYKRIFIGMLLGRLGVRFLEFFYYHFGRNNYLRSYQIAYESVESSLLEGLMLIISGLYYLRESMIFGAINLFFCAIMVFLTLGSEIPISLMRIVFATLYNLIDQTFHNMCEFEHFTNVSKVERKSLHLNQFVNRLLPKHVRSDFPS